MDRRRERQRDVERRNVQEAKGMGIGTYVQLLVPKVGKRGKFSRRYAGLYRITNPLPNGTYQLETVLGRAVRTAMSPRTFRKIGRDKERNK